MRGWPQHLRFGRRVRNAGLPRTPRTEREASRGTRQDQVGPALVVIHRGLPVPTDEEIIEAVPVHISDPIDGVARAVPRAIQGEVRMQVLRLLQEL